MNLEQIVTHVLQQAIFKHTLVWENMTENTVTDSRIDTFGLERIT